MIGQILTEGEVENIDIAHARSRLQSDFVGHQDNQSDEQVVASWFRERLKTLLKIRSSSLVVMLSKTCKRVLFSGYKS